MSGSPCSGVQITHFYFSPRTVIEGQQATLRSTVQNCTSQTFTGSLQTFGKLACVVVDPTATKVVLKPGERASLSCR